jgi:chaperone required for assembly of F1-ATPase
MIDALQRRFWDEAVVRREGQGFAIDLDAKPLQTPAGKPLVVPCQALAEAIAAEWNRVSEKIQPDLLHFTRLANTAIDRVSPHRNEVVAQIAAFGDADLLCYRADDPAELCRRQSAAWDPWLAWVETQYGAPLLPVAGLAHRPQPATSLAALQGVVGAHDSYTLAALHDLVALSGSLVLGLAVAQGAIEGSAAWAASGVDEIWQAEQWGRDADADDAASLKEQAFFRAGSMISMLETRAH